MATLFKHRVTRYLDAKGKQVPKGTPGARKSRQISKSWYGRYLDADGRKRRVKLFRDKAASQTKLNDLEAKAERQAAGMPTHFDDQGKRPLSEHLDDYRRYLLGKNNTQEYADLAAARIRAVFEGCGFQMLRDLDAGRVHEWLADARRNGTASDCPPAAGVATTYDEIARHFGVAERTVTYWRQHGAPIRPRGKNDLAAIAKWKREREREAGGMSVGTSNHYLGAVKSFGGWLVRNRRLPENVFSWLSAQNAKTDVRRERRTLAADDFARLIEAARQSRDDFRGLSGVDRSILYITAAYTGLRARELASLRDTSLDLENGLPTAAVQAAYSKRRRKDIQPLRPDLARMLAEWIADRDQEPPEGPPVLPLRKRGQEPAEPASATRGAKLWPGKWFREAAEMLRADLAAAGIPYEDAAGRVFDFHALRHQFISGLAAAGVHPKVAQTLARHSTITLTMDRYTHLAVADVSGALEGLPELPTVGQDSERLRETGTGGAGEKSCTKSASSVSISGPRVSASVHRAERDREVQETTKPLVSQGFDASFPLVSAGDTERGRRDSNPQPPDRQSGTLTN